MRTCAECGAEIVGGQRPSPAGKAGGRPPRYCSNACRQRAFRRRATPRPVVDVDLPGADPPPALDAFVGRERELRRSRSLLRSARLLSLIGPGGAGKTRLALELAHRTGRARMIRMDSLCEGEQLPGAVAEALDLGECRPDWEKLVDRIGESGLLLVLDNCEHLIESCAPPVELLLRRCPRLRILATSREPLRVRGEVIVKVGGLSLPSAQPGRAAALRSDAVRLFLERARACEPSFQLTEDNSAVVAEICRRLDGLPLAIELAARRVSALPLPHILSGLDDQLGLLTEGARTAPRRHQELRAAIEWSYRLLDAGEQAVFRRLSVLDGGFDPAAAAVVCADGQVQRRDVLRLVCALEAKSLVARESEDADAPRFHQLHTIRAYAGERLAESGELPATRRRAAGWLARLARPVLRVLCPPDDDLRALRRERDNLAAAVDYTAERGGDQHLLLAVALVAVWQDQDRPTAGGPLLDAVLCRVPESAYRPDALAAASWIACWQRLGPEGVRLAGQAVRLGRAGTRVSGLARGLDALAFAHMCQGEYPRALRAQRECLDVVSRLGELDVAYAKHNLAWLLLQTGELDEAERLLADCLDVYRRRGAGRRAHALALHARGVLRLHRDTNTAAERDFLAGLRLAQPDSDHWVSVVEGLAIAAAGRGDFERTLTLAAAADAVRDRLGVLPSVGWQDRVDEAVAGARSSLDPRRAEAAEVAGVRLHGRRLRSYLLGDRGAVADDPSLGALLTEREARIAALVAEGATNREIAERLHLSVATVRAQVTAMLGKLDLRSRTQLAVWAAGSAGGANH